MKWLISVILAGVVGFFIYGYWVGGTHFLMNMFWVGLALAFVVAWLADACGGVGSADGGSSTSHKRHAHSSHDIFDGDNLARNSAEAMQREKVMRENVLRASNNNWS